MRRLRATTALRDLVRETELSVRHLVQPLFVVADEATREPVASMPGIARLSINELVEEAGDLHAVGCSGDPPLRHPLGQGRGRLGRV